MTGIFDYHAHYDDPKFDADRDETLARVHQSGVELIINAGDSLESSRASLELADRYSFVYAAVGVHPQRVHEAPVDYLEQLEQLAAHPKAVAIGEIGLDYHYTVEHKELQHRVFREQLELAARLELPVVIHNWDAHGDTMDILREYKPAGAVHCFSGSAEMAVELVKWGMYIGFTGEITFKNARRALSAIAVIPPDRLLTETDCPYMAPEPFRGKRCDSSLLPYTIAKMAEIKGLTPEEMTRQTNQNARRLFGIGSEPG